MKPYYSHAGIEVYHGDFQEILPELPKVNLVVTDPPFYLPASISTGRKKWPRSLGNLAVMEGFFRFAFKPLVDMLLPTGAFYTFSDSTSYAVMAFLLYPLFDRTQCIVWDKCVPGLGRGWRHSHELVVHGAFSATEYVEGCRRDIISGKPLPSKERGHPSEKPVPVVGQLLSAHPKGTLLDPFAGGGGILAAAKDNGWKAIGVEIDERYAEIAAKRLSQEVLPL